MATKYYYDTSLGTYSRSRTASELKAQRDYEYQLRAEAKRTLARLRASGKLVIIHYSNSYWAASRGMVAMPIPRLTPDGYTAWTIR